MNFKDFPRTVTKLIESNILLYCVICLLILKVFFLVAFINLPFNIFFANITKTDIITFVNQGRESAGLNTLSENEQLDQAAYLKAENMLQNNYFNHTSPSGISPWHWFSEAGYNYYYAGENLAVGFYDSKEVYEAWLNSPSHRDNIFNPNYKEIGIAVLSGFGQNNAIIVVQLFGSQKVVSSVNDPVLTATEAPAEPIEIVETPEENDPVKVAQNIFPGNQLVLGEAKNLASNNFYFKLVNYVLYSYEGLIQKIIYGLSLIIIGILLVAIMFSGINFKQSFVFRAVILVALLSSAIFLDKEVFALFLPHQIII